MTKPISPRMMALFRASGRKGGKQAALNMTRTQRIERSRKALEARRLKAAAAPWKSRSARAAAIRAMKNGGIL